MSEKNRMTTWVPTIVMGVVAILFSVYALQEQSELQRVKVEMEQFRSELADCRQQLADEKMKTAGMQSMLDDALEQSKMAVAEAEIQYRRALKNEKASKKK
jgi:hypothetical protein